MTTRSGAARTAQVLTASQARALAAGLRHVERELVDVRRALGETYDGELVALEDDLSPSARAALLEQIGSVRRLLGEFRSIFDLSTERMAASRWIAGHLNLLWVVAQECRSRHLRAYGELAPGLPSLVDPLVERLGDLLLAMHATATTPRQPPGAPDLEAP